MVCIEVVFWAFVIGIISFLWLYGGEKKAKCKCGKSRSGTCVNRK